MIIGEWQMDVVALGKLIYRLKVQLSYFQIKDHIKFKNCIRKFRTNLIFGFLHMLDLILKAFISYLRLQVGFQRR